MFLDRKGNLLLEALLSLFAVSLLILILLQTAKLEQQRSRIIQKGDRDNEEIYAVYQR